MVEVETLGLRVGQPVPQDHVERHPDPMGIGLDVVAGVGDDRQAGSRRADLAAAGGRCQQAGRGDDREDEGGEPATHDPSSSGRRSANRSRNAPLAEVRSP